MHCSNLQGAALDRARAAYHMFLDSVGLAVRRCKGDGAPVSDRRYPVRQVLRLQQLRHLRIVRVHTQEVPKLQDSITSAYTECC